jgi:hypothetical protein
LVVLKGSCLVLYHTERSAAGGSAVAISLVIFVIDISIRMGTAAYIPEDKAQGGAASLHAAAAGWMHPPFSGHPPRPYSKTKRPFNATIVRP